MLKKILLAIWATASVLVIVAMFSFNALLNLAGWALVSAKHLTDLRQSQQVVENMKDRHAKKKKSARNRFAKKATKKLSVTTAAAATVGTVAVVSATSYFLIDDYCDEQQDLHVEENLLYGGDEDFTWENCLQEGTEDMKGIVADVKASSTEAVSTAMDASAEFGREKWAAIREAAGTALDATNENATELWNDVKEIFSE